MNRRNFLRAAPAAAALAPSLVNTVPSSSGIALKAPSLGTPYMSEAVQPFDEWKSARVKEIRDVLSGKRNERQFRGFVNGAVLAANIDALRSVSAVNKHRILRERQEVVEREAIRFDLGWQLFDLIGVRS